MKRESKSSRARVLLTTTDLAPREVAEVAGCAVSLVYRLRAELRLPFRRQSQESRLSGHDVNIEELRAAVATLAGRVAWLERTVARRESRRLAVFPGRVARRA